MRDENGQPTPAGERGELFVRGPSVMKGYYNRPEETSAIIDGDGWLRTGDIVELDDQQPPLQRQESHAACLRLNVPNVKQFADALSSRDISVDYQEHPWGTVAKFLDPDGNLCAFKDDEKFEQQVRDGQS